MPSFKDSSPATDIGAEFAPALDAEPVFERPAVERWAIAPRPELFEPGGASGPWADDVAAFDLEPEPGPGFLDPGSHALETHAAPMLASESMPFGALASASSDLTAPIHHAAGGGDDDDDGKDGTLAGDKDRW